MVAQVMLTLKFPVDIFVVQEMLMATKGLEISLGMLPVVLDAIMRVATQRCPRTMLQEHVEELVLAVLIVLVIALVPESIRQDILAAARNMVRIYYALDKGAPLFSAAASFAMSCCC